MKGLFSTLLACIFMKAGMAQRELVHAKDTSSIRSETIRISHFNLPAAYSRYAGIRFVDARSIKGFAGFIQQNAKMGFRKITTLKPFEAELNNAVKIKTDTSTISDSIIVLLKNFWMSRASVKDQEMSCHIRALLFTKRADSFFLREKIDTLFRRHAIVQYEYKDLPSLFIEDLLAVMPLNEKRSEKIYLQNDFIKLAYQQKQLPADSLRGNGLFFSFNDLVKGKMHKTGFSLAEFHEQFRISFDNAGEGELLAAKAWGCWYNGQLYIKNGKHYSKAFSVEHSFLLLSNPAISAKGDADASPLVLNMETGKLE